LYDPPNEQADPQIRGLEIVDDLSPVLRRQRAHGLELDQHAFEADEIGNIDGAQRRPLIFEPQRRLRHERNIPALEFQRQAFLIGGLQKADTQYTVHLEHSFPNAECLVPMEQLSFPVWSVWSVVHLLFPAASIQNNT
jgi:hypothetical protein